MNDGTWSMLRAAIARDPLLGLGRRYMTVQDEDRSIRDVGVWVNPPEARGDEDYDWQVPTSATAQALQKLVASFNERHKLNVRFSFDEKNWTSFYD